MSRSPFHGHRFPPEVIRHAVWLYLRFTLSFRDVEDLLAERVLDISYETIRRWVLKFGPIFARDAAGTPPVGWHTRSATSVNTRRLLVEQGGFMYDSNAYNDDLPYLVDVAGVSHVVLPYAFNTNDMRFQRGGGFVFAEDFARYCIDAFDRLYEEGADAPRMMSVGLHLRIIGRPGRIGGLEQFLAHAASHPGTWFARRDAIAHHWRAQSSPGSEA